MGTMTERPPPPIPATMREAVRVHNDGETAHPIVPRRNITLARRRLVLRPKISDRRPYRAWNAVLEMIYATAIQETLFKLWKSEPLLSINCTSEGKNEVRWKVNRGREGGRGDVHERENSSDDSEVKSR